MTIQLVDLKKQYESIKTEIDAVIGAISVENRVHWRLLRQGLRRSLRPFLRGPALHRRRERHGCPLCRAQSVWESETATRSSSRPTVHRHRRGGDPGRGKSGLCGHRPRNLQHRCRRGSKTGSRRKQKRSCRCISTASPPTWIPFWPWRESTG